MRHDHAMYGGDGRHRTEVTPERVLESQTGPGGTHLGRTEFTASCDCGWVGRPLATRRDADNDADEHVRLM